MEIGYRRSISGSFLAVQLDELTSYESFVLSMITENEMEGFLKPSCETVNRKTGLLYDISTRYSLNTLFELRKMSYGDLAALLAALKAGVKEMNEYLIDTDLLLMDPEYIYADYDAGIFSFCICPVKCDAKENIRAFADMIISCIDYDDQDLVRTAYELNMAMNNDNFSLEEIPDPVQKNTAPDKESIIERFRPESTAEEPVNVIMKPRKKPGPVQKESVLKKLSDFLGDMF